jgi:hypothetical protein
MNWMRRTKRREVCILSLVTIVIGYCNYNRLSFWVSWTLI